MFPLVMATLVHWNKNSRFARVIHSVPPVAARSSACKRLKNGSASFKLSRIASLNFVFSDPGDSVAIVCNPPPPSTNAVRWLLGATASFSVILMRSGAFQPRKRHTEIPLDLRWVPVHMHSDAAHVLVRILTTSTQPLSILRWLTQPGRVHQRHFTEAASASLCGQHGNG